MLYGNYESLLILQENPLEPLCPSMDPWSLVLYIKFKRSKSREPLKDIDNNKDIKDAFGNLITWISGWNDPDNVLQLLSAVSTVHASRGHDLNSQHHDQYDQSVELHLSGEKSGCYYYAMNPHHWRNRNLKNSKLLHNAINQNSKDSFTYRPHSNSPLMLWELLDKWAFLTSMNSVWDLIIWTMTLIAVKLFLREDEVSQLQLSSLNKDLSVICEDRMIDRLVFIVKGKADTHLVMLMLWPDYNIPELCPILHLVTYITVSSYKSGFMFLPKDIIDNSPAHGHFSKAISYSTN